MYRLYQVGDGRWLSIDTELVIKDGEICGTHTPSGHRILIETHFEPPVEYSAEDVEEYNRKIEDFNSYTQRESNWRDQAKLHPFSLYCKYFST